MASSNRRPAARRGAASGSSAHGSRRDAMSRPSFFADHDLNEHIVDGVLRREPALEFIRARDVGIDGRPDPEVLEYAATQSLIIVSHDVNTMPGHAQSRLVAGKHVAGLLMVRQTQPIAA